jgi:hypothetical protein
MVKEDSEIHVMVERNEPPRAPEPWHPSLWVVGAIVCSLTALALALTGCAGTTVQSGPVPGGPIPVGCYAEALQWADSAALSRCGGVWATCEHRSSILAELDDQLEACDLVSNGK